MFVLFQKYAITVSKQVGLKGPHTATGEIGKQLTPDEIDTFFTEEQLNQLFDLYKASVEAPDSQTSQSNEEAKT